MFSSASTIGRYKETLKLVAKYGSADLIDQSGIRAQLEDADDASCGRGDPDEFADDLERMGPTFVKLGQLLSTRADLLPAAYLESLARLQDHVAPIPFASVEAVVESQLGLEVDDAFAEFDREPLASASLGQVHRARLRNGRRVAVKVQRPGIIDQIEDDIKVLRGITALIEKASEVAKRYRFSRIVETLEDNLLQELDYRHEARNAASISEALAGFDDIVVPRINEELSGRRVLTMELLEGRKITDLGRLALLEIDRERLVSSLFRAYLHQILVEGCFHADPHPGNLLITDDGKIALLDFGMVGRVSPTGRGRLMKLLFAISEGRSADAARAAMDLGSPGDAFDASMFRERIERLVTRHQHEPVKELHAGLIVMEIQRTAAEAGMILTDELTLLGKTLLNLDRVVEHLHPNFDPNAAMRAACTELMQQRTADTVSRGKLFETLLDSTQLVQALPGRLDRLTERLANNEFGVRVDGFDAPYLTRGMQQVANRITMGIILGSLIVGASLMMRLETPWRLFGYPAIAMGFFLAAGAAGMILVIRILRTPSA